MTNHPLTIALHIGVHKTATTHLQRSLKHARRALAAEGVRYYGPDHFRSPGQTIPARFGFRRDPSTQAPDLAPAEQLAVMRKEGHRLVISEENFIGALNHPHGLALKTRYKDADNRIAAFANAVGQEVDVCVALRRPTGFLNAAYCQMLLGGRVQPIGLYLSRNPVSSVDWVALIARLRTASGLGRLTVWRYEDYAVLFPQIVAGLVGTEAAHLVVPRPKYVNRGLSAAAVADVLQRTDADPTDKIAAAARRMLPVEEGYPPFDGFSQAEHEMGDAIYAAQIKAIAAMDGVTLLQPQNDPT